MDLVWEMGLVPVAAHSLQWRSRNGSDGHPVLGPLWTLAQEAFFGDFWADQVPRLQAQGWAVAVKPGFAHESVAIVECDTMRLRRLSGTLLGRIMR